MTTPLPGNTSGTARLFAGGPSYAVGWQEAIYPPNPAAGADWSHKVDGRYLERLVAVTYTLTTDAVVGSRYPKVVLTDNNGKQVIVSPVYNGLAASSSILVSAWINAGALAQITANGAFTTLPDVLAPGDWVWSSETDGLDPGDTITGITMLVQRFPNDTADIIAGG